MALKAGDTVWVRWYDGTVRRAWWDSEQPPWCLVHVPWREPWDAPCLVVVNRDRICECKEDADTASQQGQLPDGG